MIPRPHCSGGSRTAATARVWREVGAALLLLLVGAAPAAAQSLHGIISSAATMGPVEGALVTLTPGDGVAHSALSDRNGFFQIGGIRPGTYSLEIRHLAHAPFAEILTFADGEAINLNPRLEPAPVELEGVTVSSRASAAIRPLGRQEIRPGELRLAPVPAGSGDLASYLQTLPGVTTAGDRGGQLFVRGGSSAENLVLVDGMPIYQPFHIVGFFSVFPSGLLRNADFYPGGFGARYNGRTSSVLDVALRDGNPGAVDASGSVSPFVAEVIAEGPAGDNTSWLVAARRSLLEETSETLLGSRQPLSFESQLIKLSSSDGEDLRCSILALRTADEGRLDPEESQSRISWENQVVGGRCVTSFERILRLFETTFSYSSLANEAVSRGSSGFRSRIWRIQHDAHATSMVGALPVYAGYQLYSEQTDFDLRELYGIHMDDGQIFGVSGYLEMSLPLGRLEIRPGLALLGEPRPAAEPRLRASLRPFGRESEVIHGALGLYHQDVAGTSDLRDVGSVFTAWLETPDDTPIEAWHGLLGWQQTLSTNLSWSAEGYYKRLRGLPVPVWQAITQFTTTMGSADGEAYGFDARVEYASPALHLFAGYGYGLIEYQAGQKEFANWFGEPIQSYHPPHDRRHQLNLAGSGHLRGFDLSARWQLGSGLPFTRPLGFDEAFDYSVQPYDVSHYRGTTRMILDRPFNARLPVMHRLDLSIGRTFRLGPVEVDVQGGAVNAYDRRNLFYYDLYSGRRVDQLPLAPYVAITGRG